MLAGCQTCGAAPVADPEAAGWGDGGRICPTCRAERNARARANLEQIGASGKPIMRVVTVRSLPDMVLRRSLTGGNDFLLSAEDAADIWRETGDGMYLITAVAHQGAERVSVAVLVEGGQVVDSYEVPEHAIPQLIVSLTAVQGKEA
jgi:hypothetical protein